MQTHLDLIYEQLDTLVSLLDRQSRGLQDWVGEDLNICYRDDYHMLVYYIDDLNTRLAAMWDHLLRSDESGLAESLLSAALRDIYNLSAALLYNHELTGIQEQQLRSIHLTSGDILDIVEEITGQ